MKHNPVTPTGVLLHPTLPRGFTTRFAPAPTGSLHLGHIVNAVWVWGFACAHGGRVLLRLEDHDRGRCRAAYEQGILDDLDWLGFVPDAPSTADFRQGVSRYRQSDNLSRYLTVLERLECEGLAYACNCSRSDIARASGSESQEPSADHEIRYPGTCRHRIRDSDAPSAGTTDSTTDSTTADNTLARRVTMAAGALEQFTDLRLGKQTQDPDAQCGDVLARDRTGHFTYQFCVTIDDMDQEVDLIIRGEDLLASTGRQLRLARLLGRTAMPQFLHHPLVRHQDGRKLSKSANDTGIRELRAAGATPRELIGRAAQLGGLPHDGSPLDVADLPGLFN